MLSVAVIISTVPRSVATFFGVDWIGPSSPEEYPSWPRFRPQV